ncbi:phosphoethanolamine transferase [Psychrobacter glaciei]|uniref:phosphoethanolamine transferase n=1 Tax=Psychrobacter glaciei TaxID=619771 RepID=UPI001F059B5E|nr:phosphoethanolamine transferase [Psychrobacter glaciei]MCH1783382.1 phosphoethanolamine transferase [Psychrobacter glaciei]
MPRLALWVIVPLIALPSLYLYSKDLALQSLLLSTLVLIYLWALLKNSRYLALLYPFTLLLPFVLFYIHYYDSPINEQILSIILESNWQEVRGFLGANIYLYIAIFIIWLIGVTALFWYNQCYPVCWAHRSRWWIIISVSIMAVSGIIAHQRVATEMNTTFADDSTNFLINEKNSLIQEFKQTYPLGVLISFYDLYQEQSKINNAFAKHQQFTFDASSSVVLKDKQVIVLVIGETSRRANWQMNGYARQTNPLLSRQANMVNFTDMLSISSATRSSIPMLLTRKPANQVYQYDFAEKSVISAFKEAGFDTYWLSTQQKFGAFDTSTSVYAKEVDNIIFLNKTNYTNRGETDEIILPALQKMLAASNKKKFIVIHTLGSHFDYAHRYPSSFNRFKPSLNELDGYSLQDKQHKQQLLNSYDNSILYTDYVLDAVIENLKTQKDSESFLLFSSDHGEDLFDASCDKSGHGNETASNFEIASFAWYSDRFAINNADKVQRLRSNQHKKINQTSIFPTLIDAADITIPNYTHERSILGHLRPYPRLVLGGKDYDNSTQKGSCREIK